MKTRLILYFCKAYYLILFNGKFKIILFFLWNIFFVAAVLPATEKQIP